MASYLHLFCYSFRLWFILNRLRLLVLLSIISSRLIVICRRSNWTFSVWSRRSYRSFIVVISSFLFHHFLSQLIISWTRRCRHRGLWAISRIHIHFWFLLISIIKITVGRWVIKTKTIRSSMGIWWMSIIISAWTLSRKISICSWWSKWRNLMSQDHVHSLHW